MANRSRRLTNRQQLRGQREEAGGVPDRGVQGLGRGGESRVDLQTGKQINKRQANKLRCDCRTFAQKGKTIELN